LKKLLETMRRAGRRGLFGIMALTFFDVGGRKLLIRSPVRWN
jgi:hypothetical protein